MRSLKKNMRSLYYALYSREIPEYEHDADGNIVYITVGTEQYPVEIGKKSGYKKPVEFNANISETGGKSASVEYGIDVTGYEAVIVTNDMTLPISETTLIWHRSEPKYNSDKTVNRSSADYKVVAVRKGLDSVKYLLKRLPED